jgi:hypothetical protein
MAPISRYSGPWGKQICEKTRTEKSRVRLRLNKTTFILLLHVSFMPERFRFQDTNPGTEIEFFFVRIESTFMIYARLKLPS